MTKSEKVKTWLNGLFKANPTICPMGDCESCPYFENKDNCYKELRTDALELLKEQENNLLIQHEEGFHEGYGLALSELNGKQFEKIVRCKDCRNYDRKNIYCDKFGIQSISDNWFCADVERR